jgi:valyl-tRNA synthetase
MNNIEPWCISRQLWWGHQIPAWYGPDGHVYVAETEEEATREAILRMTEEGYSLEDVNNMRRHEGGEAPLLVRDADVLDTWFSSALWPFSTLGWPEVTPELGKHYPTSVLVTAHDIIFFWVARMMMMGCHFMKEAPFSDVYIHALVLDEKGQKMSKSKGNVIDPLTLIDKYGADALRFTLSAMAAQGRNIRLSEARVEGYRNFGTKLWNAARFCEMNGCDFDPAFNPKSAAETLNQWIVHEAGKAAAETTAALDAYRFNDAAGTMYKFVWNIFCDWHLELAKPILLGPDRAAKSETQKTTAWVLAQSLKLLHPFMPFVTEELWSETAKREEALIISSWPQAEEFPASDRAADEINWVIGLITAIRSARAEMNVPAGAKIPMLAVGADAAISLRLDSHRDLIARLARLESIHLGATAPKGAVQIVHEGSVFALPLAGIIDIDAEKARLRKEIDKCVKEIDGIDKKMSNPNFVDKAPVEIVEENRERRAAFSERQVKLEAALKQISAA